MLYSIFALMTLAMLPIPALADATSLSISSLICFFMSSRILIEEPVYMSS